MGDVLTGFMARPAARHGSASPKLDGIGDELPDDDSLMAAFAAGSPDAFDELFTRYKQPVFGFFWRRVNDRTLAEELTQDTFVAVIRRRYRPQATFRSYLFAIAFRILRAHRRKAAFRATFFGVPPAQQEPARNSNLEAQLLVREALAKLDRIDREILLLREFEQLSYAEIAAVFGAPVNTVRSRLFRARHSLRETLSPPLPSAAREWRAQEEHS